MPRLCSCVNQAQGSLPEVVNVVLSGHSGGKCQRQGSVRRGTDQKSQRNGLKEPRCQPKEAILI
jgi:hypothetical protein